MPKMDAMQARAAFPRGLSQPERGFRFAIDSLLLACWTAEVLSKPGRRVLDLGCGCGVVGLGIALGYLAGKDSQDETGISLTGLDSDPAMIASARANAQALGISAQFLEADVREVRAEAAISSNASDVVVCNPPWRAPGAGRAAAPEREPARCLLEGTLEDFAAAAAYALSTKGRFLLVHRADALGQCVTACVSSGLTPKRLRLIHSRRGEPGKLLLLEARKAAGPGMVIEPPLVLYDGLHPEPDRPPSRGRLRAEVLALCPFLACNAGDCGNGPADMDPVSAKASDTP